MTSRRLQEALESIRSDQHTILQDNRVRYLLWEIMAETEAWSMVQPQNGEQAMFLHGKSWMGHWLMDKIFTLDPVAYTLMREEAATISAFLEELRNEDNAEGADE